MDNKKHHISEKLVVLHFKQLLKEKLEQFLIENYSLKKVDPTYITNSIYSLKPHRLISFDNALTGDIFSFTDHMDFALLQHLNDYHIFLNNGIISYYCKFTRDYKLNKTNYHSEYHFIFEYKIKVQDANKNYMHTIIKNIFSGINETIKNYRKINQKLNMYSFTKKISCTSVDEITKKYPTLKINDAINQEIILNELVLIFDVNGNNKKEINLIDNETIYNNKLFANLYAYFPSIQESARVCSIYICPTRDDLEKFVKDNHLDASSVLNNIDLFPLDDNYLIVDINFSRLLLYIFAGNNIAEVV